MGLSCNLHSEKKRRKVRGSRMGFRFNSSISINPIILCIRKVFRVVHAPVFLRHFASDRRHMKDSEGNWTSPPPEHKVIVAEDGTVHNLNQYMDMSTKDVLKDIEKESIGGVFTEQLGVLVGENQLEHFFSCISRFRELVISSLQKLTNMARFEQNPHDNHSSSLSL
nr:protein N-terminal glutamine amidohydrolase [Tanacetum cinerariifolium]